MNSHLTEEQQARLAAQTERANQIEAKMRSAHIAKVEKAREN